jgi:hypothetical protein
VPLTRRTFPQRRSRKSTIVTKRVVLGTVRSVRGPQDRVAARLWRKCDRARASHTGFLDFVMKLDHAVRERSCRQEAERYTATSRSY